jgi:DNA-binding PucR family transcriptional regulator
MLTVRELLNDLGVQVLAGAEGLDLAVRWVHITELLDPTPWLSGGEVLLTTGLQLDSPARQREFVTRLADHQLAALGFGTGLGHDLVPRAVLEIADERGFPVFEVPYELPFIAITEAAFTRLVNEQYAILRRALGAQERLERIVLSERGLEALASALAALLGATVLVFDPRGQLLAEHSFQRHVDVETLNELEAEIRVRGRGGEAGPFTPSREAGGLALPVPAEGNPARTPAAWLVAVKDSGPLSDFDRLTLHQAATIVALELLRSRVAGDTERRLAGDVLAALLSGELSGGELTRRLAPFGLPDEVAAIVLRRPDNGRGSPAPVEAALTASLRDELIPGLVASAGSLTCALVPGLPEGELFSLAERISAQLAAELPDATRLGVGRPVAREHARRSFQEARCALEALALGAGSNGGATGTPATYKDLGSFQLLLSLQDDEALKLFCDSVLGPIDDGEGQYGGELMRSLEVFLEENGHWERAAKRLYCHRHTLRYRIRRVEELTGRSLSGARDRIDFWLALRGRELVG